jgi:hypothetical protein
MKLRVEQKVPISQKPCSKFKHKSISKHIKTYLSQSGRLLKILHFVSYILNKYFFQLNLACTNTIAQEELFSRTDVYKRKKLI